MSFVSLGTLLNPEYNLEGLLIPKDVVHGKVTIPEFTDEQKKLFKKGSLAKLHKEANEVPQGSTLNDLIQNYSLAKEYEWMFDLETLGLKHLVFAVWIKLVYVDLSEWLKSQNDEVLMKLAIHNAWGWDEDTDVIPFNFGERLGLRFLDTKKVDKFFADLGRERPDYQLGVI